MNSIIIYFFLTWVNRHIFNALFKRFKIPNDMFVFSNVTAISVSAAEITLFNAYPFTDLYDFGVYFRISLLFLLYPQIVWWSCDLIKQVVYKSRRLGKNMSYRLEELVNQLCFILLVSFLFSLMTYYFMFGRIGGPLYYADTYRLIITGKMTASSDEGWPLFILRHMIVWISFYLPFIFNGLYRLFSHTLSVGRRERYRLQEQRKRSVADPLSKKKSRGR